MVYVAVELVEHQLGQDREGTDQRWRRNDDLHIEHAFWAYALMATGRARYERAIGRGKGGTGE